MKKRSKITLSITLLCFGSIILYILLTPKQKILGHYISFFSFKDDPTETLFVDQFSAPHFSISMTPSSFARMGKLNSIANVMRQTVGSPEHLPAFENYTKLRKWEKGRLTYKNQTFKIKVKIHGKSPAFDHSNKNRFSLTVKILNNMKLLGAKRFNLIILKKDIRHSAENRFYPFAEKLGLYKDKKTLVKVSVNTRKSYLAYFEYRMNESYFQQEGYPSLLELSSDSIKTLIINSIKLKT